MAISVRNTSSNSSTTGTDISVSAPSGTTTGDVVIIFIHGNGQTTIVDNNGSTPFTEDLNDFKPNTSYGHTVSIFSRRIIDGDPSTYSFTLGASGRWSIIAYSLIGVDTGSIYDASLVTDSAESDGSTFDAPSITTVTDNALHMAMACLDDATVTVTGFPADYTSTVSEGDQPTGVAVRIITPAGSTGAKTFSFSGSSSRIGVSLAIKPVVTAGTNSRVGTLTLVGVGD